MDVKANADRVSVAAHSVAAILAGYVSLLVQNSSRAFFGLLAGIAILAAVGYLSGMITGKNITEKSGLKWWLGNGLFIYLMLWIICWMVFFNPLL